MNNMPHVDIYYKEPEVLREQHTTITSVLCDMLPRQLTCVDDAGEPILVKPEMVKIRFIVGSQYDTHTKDFEVRVFARDFKSRRPHYQSYSNELQDAIGHHLPQGSTINVLYVPITAFAAGVAVGT